MTNSQDAIAAFLAKGGKVAKVVEGASNGMTAGQWHRAARDVEVSRVVSDNDLIGQRIDLGHSVVNGLGETVYLGN